MAVERSKLSKSLSPRRVLQCQTRPPTEAPSPGHVHRCDGDRDGRREPGEAVPAARLPGWILQRGEELEQRHESGGSGQMLLSPVYVCVYWVRLGGQLWGSTEGRPGGSEKSKFG